MMDNKTVLSGKDELEFVIFCIENVAIRLRKDAKNVFDALQASGMISGYIVPEYEVLHTQGKEYIINDIIEVMEERGIAV